jgi:hypothetical protein
MTELRNRILIRSLVILLMLLLTFLLATREPATYSPTDMATSTTSPISPIR